VQPERVLELVRMVAGSYARRFPQDAEELFSEGKVAAFSYLEKLKEIDDVASKERCIKIRIEGAICTFLGHRGLVKCWGDTRPIYESFEDMIIHGWSSVEEFEKYTSDLVEQLHDVVTLDDLECFVLTLYCRGWTNREISEIINKRLSQVLGMFTTIKRRLQNAENKTREALRTSWTTLCETRRSLNLQIPKTSMYPRTDV